MPVEIGGKNYWTVAERLKLANGEHTPSVGISTIVTDIKEVGSLVVVTAQVTFGDGRSYCGMASVNTESRSRIESSAPVEVAETSAVGRALAMAGYYGSPEGIAGYEEMMLAQQRAEARASRSFPDGSSSVTRTSTAAPRPAARTSFGDGGGSTNYEATPAQIRYLGRLWSEAGRPMPAPDMTGQDRRKVSALIDELRTELGLPASPPNTGRE